MVTKFIAHFTPYEVKKMVNQSHYRVEVTRGFQELKATRLRDNAPGWR